MSRSVNHLVSRKSIPSFSSHGKAQISMYTIQNIATQKINGKMLHGVESFVWYSFHTGAHLDFRILVRLHEFSSHVFYLSHIIEQMANRYTMYTTIHVCRTYTGNIVKGQIANFSLKLSISVQKYITVDNSQL